MYTVDGGEEYWVAVELPEELVEKLVEHAKRRGVTISMLVEEAIKHFMEQECVQPIPAPRRPTH